MSKYFAFSIDDGTVYDEKTIALFSRYGVHATFNLNSELSSFVWYLGDTPIRRIDHSLRHALYDGHEVASHTLTHPDLALCPDYEVYRQVRQDKDNLEAIFGRKVYGFATPFESSGDREVEIIKGVEGISYIRLSVLDESFSLPKDPYHLLVTALDIDRALELLPLFKQKQGDALFLYAGHSYDFALQEGGFIKLERLLREILEDPSIEILPVIEAVKRIF